MTQPVAGAMIEGKYRLERELGAGGMGAVWLATQLMVDRKVAVKLLHPSFLDQEELQRRFEVEAKAIGKLYHPNCITLYDFGYSQELGAFYTVIEFIDGVSLDKKLGTQMTTAYVSNIIREIALALDHAHYHGILHRDLKPENVMLARMTDGSEIAKVLDFGIARIVQGQFAEPSDEDHRITKAGEVFGTPAYMSPEQARSTRTLTPASDLYALGVMYFELLTGQLPFYAPSAFDLLMLHVTEPVPKLPRSDVSDDVKQIIDRLLQKNAEERFQSGKELADAIAKADTGASHAHSQPLVIETQGFDGERNLKTEATLEFQQSEFKTDKLHDTESEEVPAHLVPTLDADRSSTVHSTSVRRGNRRMVVALLVLFLLFVGLAGSFVLPLLFDDPPSADARSIEEIAPVESEAAKVSAKPEEVREIVENVPEPDPVVAEPAKSEEPGKEEVPSEEEPAPVEKKVEAVQPEKVAATDTKRTETSSRPNKKKTESVEKRTKLNLGDPDVPKKVQKLEL